MSDRKVVIFETAGIDAEERLVREYIVPAFQRLGGRDDVRWLMFNRYGADPSVTGGEVTFYLFGDVEAVADDERNRWDALVANGFAEEWWTDDTDVRIEEFEEEERLRHRMRATASRMSVEFFEEFDELPDAIDEFDDGENFGIGWWICLHHVVNQLGYQANDGEEEMDMLFEDIRNRFYLLATGVGVERAQSKVDEFVAELGSLKPDLQRYREERGEHEHRYADQNTFEEG